MCDGTLTKYLKKLKEEAQQNPGQSSNFISGKPGSSTSASNKGKSTNFSKASKKGKSTKSSKKKNSDNLPLSSIPGSAPHYGDAMPSQQAPPMQDTFVSSQVGTDSMNWLGENLQSNDEDLDSVVRPKNPSLFKRALGFVSSLVGASPQEPQFSPSMHDTSAASSYYPSNQPDDQTLESMVTPRNQKGFDGTPFLPNQSQSTGWPGASNFFSPTPNTSNFTSGNPGSSAKPFQQVPMPGTSFPSFPNYPSNQSAQLNSSTNFGLSQTETNWSGGNSQNNAGTLDSVVNKRKPSSSKGTNATKTGKKPRK